MNDAENRFGIFGPAQAAIRNYLGEFFDEWMAAKVALVRKLKAQIELEGDSEKLKDLRAQLNDALLSEADIAQMDTRATKLLEMMKTHFTKLKEIRTLRETRT